MTLKIPGTVRQGGTTAPSNPLAGVSSTAATATYIVRSGDSLSKIAARNGTTVSALRELNSLRSDLLQIGQELKIPAAPAGAPNAMGASSPLPPPGATSSGDQVTIKVQRGDTLGEIARKFDVTVADLMSANNITDPTRIRVGQTLVIPGFQAVGSGAIPRAEPPRSSTPTTTTTTTPAQTPPPLPVESPMEVDAPPVIPTSPAPERPPEFDAPAADEEAPPVQPLDEPMPAP
jgi:LysM repeat protein